MAFGFGVKRWKKRTAAQLQSDVHDPDDRQQIGTQGHRHGLIGHIWSTIPHSGRMFLVYCGGIAVIIWSVSESDKLMALCKMILAACGFGGM